MCGKRNFEHLSIEGQDVANDQHKKARVTQEIENSENETATTEYQGRRAL